MDQRTAQPNSHRFLWDFCAGGGAGAFSKIIVFPLVRLVYAKADHRLNTKQVWFAHLKDVIRSVHIPAFNFAIKDFIRPFILTNNDAKTELLFVVNCASGAIAGVATLLIDYPLVHNNLSFQNNKAPTSFSQYYRGLSYSLISRIPFYGAYFGLYDTLSHFNPYKDLEERIPSNYLIALFTTISANILTHPFAQVNRKINIMYNDYNLKQIGHTPLPSITSFTRSIIKTDGFRALYKNMSLSFSIHSVFASAITLVVYDEIKRTYI